MARGSIPPAGRPARGPKQSLVENSISTVLPLFLSPAEPAAAGGRPHPTTAPAGRQFLFSGLRRSLSPVAGPVGRESAPHAGSRLEFLCAASLAATRRRTAPNFSKPPLSGRVVMPRTMRSADGKVRDEES